MGLFQLPVNHIERLKVIIKIILSFILIGIIAFAIWQFTYSSILKSRADALVQSQPQTALFLYQQAKSTFPFRTDIDDPLKKTQLIIQKKMQSEDTTQSVVDLPRQKPAPTNPPLFPAKPTPTPIIPPEKLTVPILMYHHIRINPLPANPLWAALNVSPGQLNQQLQYLTTNGYHTITLDQLYLALQGHEELPDKPIVLTFDDGYRSFYDNAYPSLKFYNLKATEFIITNYVLQKYEAYLTTQQILEMDTSGLITFGAHTKDHPDLTRISKKMLNSEIQGSKNDLEILLKKPVHWFAYPYGAYNANVIKSVQAAGFEGALSTIVGKTQTMATIYIVPRIMVDGRWSLQTFIQNIQFSL